MLLTELFLTHLVVARPDVEVVPGRLLLWTLLFESLQVFVYLGTDLDHIQRLRFDSYIC